MGNRQGQGLTLTRLRVGALTSVFIWMAFKILDVGMSVSYQVM